MSLLSRVVASTLIAVMVSVLVLPSAVLAAPVPAPGTPTLLSPSEGWSTTEKKPLITGLTQNDTQVAVYIDDTFNGRATVKNGTQGTASFAYTPFLDLTPGWHTVKVKSQDDRTGLESATTLVRSFYVDLPLPAPTLTTPVVNEDTTWSKPWITGLSKNDTVVHVYIDGVYNGKTKAVNDESGTASFSYQPFLELTPGSHQVKVVAKDAKGKTSVSSTTLEFNVYNPKTVTTTVNSDEANTEQDENQNQDQENKNTSEEGEQSSSEEGEQSSSEEGEESEEGNNLSEEASNSTIGWAMLIAIAAGLVYRNRRSVKGFFNEQNQGGGTPSSGSSDSPSSTVEVITKKDDDKPNSPPPASNY